MPKGQYRRDGEFGGTVWSVEQDEWLKARCTTEASYGVIAVEFNVAFPNDHKSRSAIIGRAARQGYTKDKPGSWTKGKRRARPPSVRKVGRPKRTVAPVITLAPVVFKDAPEAALREEGRLASFRHGRRKTAQEIEEAKRGHIPSIVENAPLTSVPLSDCASNGCRWPTNDDDGPLHVCGTPATVGSYCARHANVAFREMPTPRRNQGYARRGLLDHKK